MKKFVHWGVSAAMALAFTFLFAACGGGTSVVQLASPGNIRIEKTMLVWDEVEHASGYLVSLDGTERETEKPSFSLQRYAVTGKEYTIEIVARGDGEAYLDSAPASFTFTFRIPPETGTDGAGLHYTLLEDWSGYELTDGSSASGVVEIPASFKNLPVKRIGEFAFSKSKYTGGLIGPDDFSDPFTGHNCATGITAIHIPDTVETIGTSAFINVINLEEIVIPDSVKEIGASAFLHCLSLKHVTLPKVLKAISSNCFMGCALTEIEFPEGLEEIGEWAFRAYSTTDQVRRNEIEKIELPDSVKRIGSLVFAGCDRLAEIKLPDDMDYFGSGVFSSTAWADTQPQEGPLMIGDILYGYGGEIEGSYTIPDGVRLLAVSALGTQPKLTELIIPAGIKISGNLGSMRSLQKLVLPSDLKVLPDSSCIYYQNLTELEIPDSVEKIEDSAIGHCGFDRVVIPASVKYLGDTRCTLYYVAGEEEWAQVEKSESMLSSLEDGRAEVYFYSETEPAGGGKYWHYVNGVPTDW